MKKKQMSKEDRKEIDKKIDFIKEATLLISDIDDEYIEKMFFDVFSEKYDDLKTCRKDYEKALNLVEEYYNTYKNDCDFSFFKSDKYDKRFKDLQFKRRICNNYKYRNCLKLKLKRNEK